MYGKFYEYQHLQTAWQGNDTPTQFRSMAKWFGNDSPKSETNDDHTQSLFIFSLGSKCLFIFTMGVGEEIMERRKKLPLKPFSFKHRSPTKKFMLMLSINISYLISVTNSI